MKRPDDGLTIAAVAVIAGCIATIAHEALGHGGACLAQGGTITRLTSVYFECSVNSTWVAAAGPVGNLLAAALAFGALRLLPERMARSRLLAFLVSAISLFWFAGYLLYSAFLNDGDLYFVARDLLGEPSMATRGAAIGVGVFVYALGAGIARTFAQTFAPDRARFVLRLSWAAASASACLATLAYAPDRFSALLQGALEIGAASLPLLARSSIARGDEDSAPAIARSGAWIACAFVCYVVFVLTLGRGLP